MNSAIDTVESKIKNLKIELRTWSDPRNFSQRIIDECNQEIKEHEDALVILKSKDSLMTINDSVSILEQSMVGLVKFDSDNDGVNFILDIVNKYKKHLKEKYPNGV